MTWSCTLNVPLSSEAVRRSYDVVGGDLARPERHESRAKASAIRMLEVTPWARILNVGVGAGHEQRRLQDCAGASEITIGSVFRVKSLSLNDQSRIIGIEESTVFAGSVHGCIECRSMNFRSMRRLSNRGHFASIAMPRQTNSARSGPESITERK
jgi:hypothetical protein